MAQSDATKQQLLDTAESLIRDRGYNAFSYKDLANSVGIRTASIHYHYPAKSDLGVGVMGRYTDQLATTLAGIDAAHATYTGRLKAFFKLYARTESFGGICVCGSLASDLNTLSEELQEAVGGYLERTKSWLKDTIDRGVAAGEFTYDGKAADAAASVLAALQGALIISRTSATRSSQVTAVQRVSLGLLGAA